MPIAHANPPNIPCVVTFDHVHVGGGCSVMPTTKLPDAKSYAPAYGTTLFPASMASSNT